MVEAKHLTEYDTLKRVMPDFIDRIACNVCRKLTVGRFDFDVHEHITTCQKKNTSKINKSKSTMQSDESLYNIFKALDVECQGCNQVMKISDLLNHQKQCIFDCESCGISTSAGADHNCVQALK